MRFPGVEPAAPAPSPTPSVSLPPFDPSEDRVVGVVGRTLPAVVNVTANVSSDRSQQAEGTGFVVREDGVIVTNFHVVEQGLDIRVVTADGTRLEARVIGGDPGADLAVLKAEPESPLPTLPIGASSELQLGERVIALGFALGLEGGPSVTTGIVSATGRTLEAVGPRGDPRTYEDLVQTDAAINPGNSGGPLVDLDGRVVGINTAGVQASAAENIGFAIGIDRARPVIEQAMRDPDAPQPYLGVSLDNLTPVQAGQLGLPIDEGALVVDLAPGGPAEQAGIRPGDVIVRVAGQDVGSSEAIGGALQGHRPDEVIEVVVVHPTGAEEAFDVTLGTRPLPIEG